MTQITDRWEITGLYIQPCVLEWLATSTHGHFSQCYWKIDWHQILSLNPTLIFSCSQIGLYVSEQRCTNLARNEQSKYWYCVTKAVDVSILTLLLNLSGIIEICLCIFTISRHWNGWNIWNSSSWIAGTGISSWIFSTVIADGVSSHFTNLVIVEYSSFSVTRAKHENWVWVRFLWDKV